MSGAKIASRLRGLIASWPDNHGDPPDTEYQHGYMAACTDHARQLERILAEAEQHDFEAPMLGFFIVLSGCAISIAIISVTVLAALC